MVGIEINSDAELLKAVDEVSAGLQSIQDYLKANPEKSGRIKFPRGYLRQVNSHVAEHCWVEDSILAKNIAYQQVYVDTLRWLINRTDIFSAAKDMVLKNIVITNAAIFEALLFAAIGQLQYKDAKVPGRLKRLRIEGVIDEHQLLELSWLWELRHNIHIQIINGPERERYSVSVARRSMDALSRFKSSLNNHFLFNDFS